MKILGIDPITQYLGCLKCSGRIQEDEEDSEIGHCTKCHLLQCIENCYQNVTAQITIQGSDGIPLRLRAFTKVIYHIVEKEQLHLITPKMILKARAFNFLHLNGVISPFLGTPLPHPKLPFILAQTQTLSYQMVIHVTFHFI